MCKKHEQKFWLKRAGGGKELIRHVVFIDFVSSVDPRAIRMYGSYMNRPAPIINYFLIRLCIEDSVEYNYIYQLRHDYLQILFHLQKAARNAFEELVNMDDLGISDKIILPSILEKGYFYYNLTKFRVEKVNKENSLVVKDRCIYAVVQD